MALPECWCKVSNRVAAISGAILAPIPCSCRVPIMAPVHTNTKHHHQQVPPPEHHQQLQHQNTAPVQCTVYIPEHHYQQHVAIFTKKDPLWKKLYTSSPEQCLENTLVRTNDLHYNTCAHKHQLQSVVNTPPSHETQNILKMHYRESDISFIIN